jgi:hypothetical protein
MTCVQDFQLYAERSRCVLQFFFLGFGKGAGWVGDQSHNGRGGKQLTQKLKSLSRNGVIEHMKSGNAAARPRKLATKPNWTGSTPTSKTIGIVVVAALAAMVEGVPYVAIAETLRLTRSAARAGS